MPRHHPSRTLGQILDIRLVQRQAAQAQVARAVEQLAERERERGAADQRLAQAETRWRAALSGPSMALHLMGALSAEVLVQEAGVDQAADAVTKAEGHKAQTQDAWRAALANEDAAKALTRAARRVEVRRRDETALNAAADRLSQQEAPR